MNMNTSKILKAAHAEMKASNFTKSWSECLKSAWNAAKAKAALRAEIVAKLKAGVCVFKYAKNDGTERLAVGTLDGRFFSYTAKGGNVTENTEYVRYYDLQRQEWRMFSLDRFIEFCELQAVTDMKYRLELTPAKAVLFDYTGHSGKLEVLAETGCNDSDKFCIELSQAAAYGVSALQVEQAAAFIEAMNNIF